MKIAEHLNSAWIILSNDFSKFEPFFKVKKDSLHQLNLKGTVIDPSDRT